jgi:hypothetical protein
MERKVGKKKHEYQSSINKILKDKIEKKKQMLKDLI